MPRQARVIVPGFPTILFIVVIIANRCSSNAVILSTTWRIFRNGSRSMSWTTKK
ncbi:hypothetical protein ATI45_4053 [Marinobacter sp. LV10MA510-1]|nr:hypothetical protein ATI45_4053 [Marinobacter sp. LV10MA510-1]